MLNISCLVCLLLLYLESNKIYLLRTGNEKPSLDVDTTKIQINSDKFYYDRSNLNMSVRKFTHERINIKFKATKFDMIEEANINH